TVVSVSGGKLMVSESYEGIEAGEIYVLGGEINVASSDDGFNAAGETSGGMLFGKGAFGSSGSEKIVISGGRITVSAGGDGIDSNGSLEFTGGVTLVNGPSDSANGALDCESSPIISGGVVMAVGSSGMAVSFSDSSAQGSILTNVNAQSGGGRLYLCDEDGNVLCSMDTEKQYNCIIVSCPELEAGKTYVFCIGDGSVSVIADGENALSGESVEVIARVEMTSLHYSDSVGGGMGGGFKGGGMGGMNPGAGRPGGF
ncbi:MAG: dockerin type 1, partial [Eubacteriales bacterium]